jgi:hypothetical protein
MAKVLRAFRDNEEGSAPIRFEEILEKVEGYKPDFDEELLQKAYIFSALEHKGQIRRSGEPYLIHPLNVAYILAEMKLDETSIAVGLLHDVLEDRWRSSRPRTSGRCSGDGGGRPGRAHQARRPAPQHAHAPAPAAREAAAHRPPDDGDLRAAGRAARHVADQVGARGPLVQVPRAGEVPPARRHARDRRARDVRQQEHRHPAQGARARSGSRPRSAAARSTCTRSGRRWSARAPTSPRSTTSTPSACSSTT